MVSCVSHDTQYINDKTSEDTSNIVMARTIPVALDASIDEELGEQHN